jgi:hypothetical protein
MGDSIVDRILWQCSSNSLLPQEVSSRLALARWIPTHRCGNSCPSIAYDPNCRNKSWSTFLSTSCDFFSPPTSERQNRFSRGDERPHCSSGLNKVMKTRASTFVAKPWCWTWNPLRLPHVLKSSRLDRPKHMRRMSLSVGSGPRKKSRLWSDINVRNGEMGEDWRREGLDRVWSGEFRSEFPKLVGVKIINQALNLLDDRNTRKSDIRIMGTSLHRHNHERCVTTSWNIHCIAIHTKVWGRELHRTPEFRRRPDRVSIRFRRDFIRTFLQPHVYIKEVDCGFLRGDRAA